MAAFTERPSTEGAGDGTVFRMAPSGTTTILHTFNGGATGGTHAAGLIQGPDGNFYGTTETGGDAVCQCGTVFMMTPAGIVTILHAFAGGQSDGSRPRTPLVLGSDGNFYGTTEYGGCLSLCGPFVIGPGTVFRITPDGGFTLLHAFAEGSIWDLSCGSDPGE